MQILTGLGERPEKMAFSPDGRYLAGGDSDGFHLWDLSAGAAPLWSRAESDIGVNFCFASSGSAILGGRNYLFASYDVRTGRGDFDRQLSDFNPRSVLAGRPVRAGMDRGRRLLSRTMRSRRGQQVG